MKLFRTFLTEADTSDAANAEMTIVYAYNISCNYRNSYNLKIWNGILFNHESERRGENFVTRKTFTLPLCTF